MTYTTYTPKFTGRNVPIAEITKATGKRPAIHKDRLAKRDIQVRICVQER